MPLPKWNTARTPANAVRAARERNTTCRVPSGKVGFREQREGLRVAGFRVEDSGLWELF